MPSRELLVHWRRDCALPAALACAHEGVLTGVGGHCGPFGLVDFRSKASIAGVGRPWGRFERFDFRYWTVARSTTSALWT